MEVIEVIEREIEVIEVIERGPQGPQGAGITTLTTQGDLLYRGATTGERLPIGTTGQILKVSSGGIPEWGAAPSSGVSSVSGTSPIVSSGGSTPAISITAATTSAAGSMSAEDKTKLDGIASGAEVNVNADWNASSGDAQILNKPTIPSTAADVGAVPTSRTISAGTGLTGGGDLSANRTLAVSYGTTAGTACQGNDSRLSDARTPTAHTHVAADITDLQTNGNAAGLWDSVNDEQLVSTGDGELQIRKTGTALSGAFNASVLSANRGYNLPDASGTLALTTTVVDNATGLWDSANSVTGLTVADYTVNVTDGTNTSSLIFPVGASRNYTLPNAAGTLALTSDITKTAVGLGNVANVDTTNAANISSGVLPNARVNWAAPSAIGSTIAAAGNFTTLSATPSSGSAFTITGGTVTTSAPLINATQTWNAGAVTFAAFRINATDTASASGSMLADFQVGGTSKVKITKAGTLDFNVSNFTTLIDLTGAGSPDAYIRNDGSRAMSFSNCFTTHGSAVGLNIRVGRDVPFGWSSNTTPSQGSLDLVLVRDAADTLAQRNGTTAQEKRLYGTYTSSTNYQRMTIRSVKQTLSALSGASATTTGTFIPDGAVVVGVTTRVATTITGATGYQIGDGTDADRWGDITGTAIGTTSDNRDWTAGTIECFTAGGNITLTAKTSNFTAGAIEICVFYLAGEAD